VIKKIKKGEGLNTNPSLGDEFQLGEISKLLISLMLN